MQFYPGPISKSAGHGHGVHWRGAERRDPLCGLVYHGTDRLALRASIVCTAMKFGPGHVSVHMLEGQRQVAERVQPVL
jgi:hypothetical protein